MKIFSLIHKEKPETFIYNAYSFLYGFIGFLSFLSIIIIAKFFNHLMGEAEFISVDVLDIIMAISGFVMIFIFKRFEIINKL